jgi:hypothetical protein
MKKVQKAIAKLYFALGEHKEERPIELPKAAEITAAMLEYTAFLAIRESADLYGFKYFMMGEKAAERSALRQRSKPPKGKTPQLPAKSKLSPPKGKKALSQGRKKGKAKREEEGFDEDFNEDGFENEW